MKKSTMVLALLGCGMLTAFGGENLVKNGDFETGKLTGWNSNQQRGGEKTIYSVSADQKKSGNHSLSISGDQANKFKDFLSLVQRVTVPVQAGDSYKLAAAIKSAVAPGSKSYVQVAVRQVNDQDKSVVYNQVTMKKDAKDWQDYSVVFKIQPKTKYLQIYVIASNLADTDQAFVDNITLEKM